jgi:fructokinase
MIQIGIDLGGTKIEAIALDANGATLARRRVSTPKHYAETLREICGLVARIEQETGQAGTIGIGHPGSISPATGLMRNANSTWLNHQPFDQDLASCLKRPLRLANDADCFALSEARDGAAANAHIVFGVILGTGVGGGIVIDGKLLSGAQKIAGEWGHNPLPWPLASESPGPECWCGRLGCIETWISGPGMAADHARRYGDNLPAHAIFSAAAIGEANAASSMDRYVDRLSRSLASVINVLDADIVVLGGGVSNVESLAGRVQTQLSDRVFSDHLLTRIVPNQHGDSSGVRGAAMLWPADA